MECQPVISVLRWQTYQRHHNCVTQPYHSAGTPLSRPVISSHVNVMVTDCNITGGRDVDAGLARC